MTKIRHDLIMKIFYFKIFQPFNATLQLAALDIEETTRFAKLRFNHRISLRVKEMIILLTRYHIFVSAFPNILLIKLVEFIHFSSCKFLSFAIIKDKGIL